MSDKLQERLTAVPLTVGRGLTGLFWEMLPPVLFFFIALMLIFAVVKLLALQYSIRFYAFARAAIGALVLGKIVLLMEMAERKRNESRYPRAIVVAFKTVIYAMAVVFLNSAGE
jgi:fumarate reductase subunit D